MISSAHKLALRTISESLVGVKWCLVGSTNLAIQGVAIDYNDIDIRIKVSDVGNVAKLLSKYCVKPLVYSETDKFASYFGRYDINGVEVEVIAGLRIKPNQNPENDDSIDVPKIVNVDTLSVPCLSLEDELKTYIKLGRTSKSKLIEDAIG